jgi:plasmid stabilization system protein ParE
MSVPVIFHNLAIADVEEAFCWYQEKQPDLGDSFIAELENKEEQISANPELYPRIYRNVHRAILHKFPFSAFYVIFPEFVSVIAVMHHSRDPQHWQKRS